MSKFKQVFCSQCGGAFGPADQGFSRCIDHHVDAARRHVSVYATVALTILGEPASKANSRRLVTFGNRPAFVKSDKAQAYELGAIPQISHEHRRMLTGPLRVTMRIYYASERPDLDESVILDVLQARYHRPKRTGVRELWRKGVYVNDRQVREKHVYHGIDPKNPRAEIVIEALTPQQEAIDLSSVGGGQKSQAEVEGVPF